MNIITLTNLEEIIESLLIDKDGKVVCTITRESAEDLVDWLERLLSEEG